MNGLGQYLGEKKRLERILLVITHGDAAKTRMYLERIGKNATTNNEHLDRALVDLVEIAIQKGDMRKRRRYRAVQR